MSSIKANISTFCTSQSGKYELWRMIFIIVLGFLAYSNTFYSPFSFDDSATIVNNPLIMNLSPAGIKEAFISRRAIGVISFQLNYFLSGWSLPWYHLTNILIHTSTALAVYKLLQLLMITPYITATADERFRNLPLPLIVALLFVAHPVQTQAVTYVVQRFASLATLFYVVSTDSYLKARLTQFQGDTYLSSKSIAWFTVSIVSALLAFYTKETAYTLPLAIILVELLFFSCNLKKVVWLFCSSGLVVFAMFFKFASAFQSVNSAITILDEATRIQTITSRFDYLITQFRVIVTYLRLLFVPINQRLDYDYVLSHSFYDWQVLCSFAVIMSLLLCALLIIKIPGDTAPFLRLTSAGILWFFLTLSIESSIIPIIDLIFEHRLYLPSIGAMIAFTSLVMMSTRKIDELSRSLVYSIMILLSLALSVGAYKRNNAWQSEVALWADATKKSPESARAWNNLGAAYIKKKEPLSALKSIIRSIELDPSKADAWNNIGIAIDLMGAYNERFHRTTEMFRQPASIGNKNVNRWLGEVNNNLGLAYEIVGNLKKAAENYSNAVAYDPSLGLAYYNLGIANAKRGFAAGFSEQEQILMMIDPGLAERLRLRVGKR